MCPWYEGMNGSAIVAAEEGEGAWGVPGPGPVRRRGRRLTQDFDPTRRYRVRWQVHIIYSTHPQGGNVLTASHLNQARVVQVHPIKSKLKAPGIELL